MRIPKHVDEALTLGLNIVVAAALFLLIGLAAVALNVFIEWCEHGKRVSPVVITGMRGVESFLWTVDVLSFLQHVFVEAVKFSRNRWSELRRDR